jgi:hypothetical protein
VLFRETLYDKETKAARDIADKNANADGKYPLAMKVTKKELVGITRGTWTDPFRLVNELVGMPIDNSTPNKPIPIFPARLSLSASS